MTMYLFKYFVKKQQYTPVLPFFLLVLMLALMSLICVPQQTHAKPEQANQPLDETVLTPPLRKVRVQLQWWPQAQFAGILTAKENGIYAAHGLDVEIVRGGPDKDLLDDLYDGTVQFATAQLGDALLNLKPDQPAQPLNVLQLVHRSNAGFMTFASDNIRIPEDLDGKNVSVWSGGPLEKYLRSLSAQNIHPKIYPQYGSIELFLQKAVSVCSAMLFAEYVTAQLAGYTQGELRYHRLDDLGWDIPEDGIYCLDLTWRKNPELVRAFVEATREGWIAARDNPAKSAEHILLYRKKEHLSTSIVGNQLMLDQMLSSIFDTKKPFACVPEEGYASAVRLLEINAPTYAQFVLEEMCHD